MPKFKINTNKTLIQLKSRLSRGDMINDRELEFLYKHYICGLFKISFDGKRTIRYTAPLSISLQKYLAARALNEAEFWRLIVQVVEICRTVEISGLYQSHLILDKQTVFVNEATGEMYFIYQPVDSPQFSANALALLHTIAYDVKKREGGDERVYLLNFLQFLEQHYHIEQICKYVEQVCPQAYSMVRRVDEDKGGFITTNPLERRRHFEEIQKKFEADTGLPSDEIQGTMLLTEEERTMLLAGTEDDEATTLLTREKHLVLVRTRDGRHVSMSGNVFRMGKSTQNDYCIDGNTAVSRVHAVIERRGGEFYMSDLNSTNGTKINGSRLQSGEEILLNNKDELMLADEQFFVELD